MTCIAQLALAVVGAQQFNGQLMIDEAFVQALHHQVAIGDVDIDTFAIAARFGLANKAFLTECRQRPAAQTQAVSTDDANHAMPPEEVVCSALSGPGALGHERCPTHPGLVASD